MSKYCYSMRVEYDGSNFHGWQIQPGKRTVQQIIGEAIKAYVREDIRLEGAGRTDAGVHAIGQVASFCVSRNYDVADLYYRLNRILPDDVAVKSIKPVQEGFAPRRSATRRTYRYYITETPQPLIRNRCHEVYSRLDIAILNRAAGVFKGRHDFRSFCKLKSLKSNNYCRVYKSKWFRYGGLVIYEVEADRFLHHMVRRMVGSMLAVNNLKLNLTQLKAFVNNKSIVKFSVPAKGLVLVNVSYRREKR